MREKTRIATLTPPGAAAVATIAVIGPRAWEIVRSAVRSPTDQPLAAAPETTRILMGVVGESPGDSVVVTVHGPPPVAWVEIHCHGGPQVVRWIMEQFSTRGVEVISWQDFVRETASSPIRAEAEIALAAAPTARAAAILLDQASGALDAAFAKILAHIDGGNVAGAQQSLSDLLDWADLGLHLVRPWRVVIAGAPNVGKSSLVNRLAGYQRSIVTATPGTTRDLVATPIAVDGWPVELIDTAGQRRGSDELEAAGIELARESELTADLVLWLIEPATHEGQWPAPSKRTLLVFNKIDLATTVQRPPNATPISALTGAGLDELLAEMARRLVPRVPPAGAPVPFAAELVKDIAAAANHLASGHVLESAATLRKWLCRAANAS